MKPRQKELLELLIEEKSEYVSSIKLAESLSLSDRTIRNYVKYLRDVLEDNGGQIFSKTGFGYKLDVVNENLFNLFLEKNLQKEQILSSEFIEDSNQRRQYLINLLLIEERTVNIEELSEKLYISESQLYREFLEIKKIIKQEGLVVEKRSNGYKVVGDERTKRHVIMKYFFSNDFDLNLFDYKYLKMFNIPISFEDLTIIVLDECRESSIKLSDYIIQNIVLHISLSIKRIVEGIHINAKEDDLSLNTKKEYVVSKKIIERIEKMTGISFPDEEATYLTLHLISKSRNYDEVDNEMKEYLEVLLQKISSITNISFDKDLQLYNGLIDHLKPMLIRIQKDIYQENPLLNDIMTEYSNVFDLTKCYFEDFATNLGIDKKINNDELAYIALHLLASIERQKDKSKLKAIIICASGYGSAQLLKARVETEFGSQINIVGVMGYYEITNEKLQDVDFIISSVDMSAMMFKEPVFHVSVFFNEQDISKIRGFIDFKYSQQSLYLTESEIKMSDIEKDNIKNMIAGNIIFYKEKSTKEHVINDLLNLLKRDEEEDYFDSMKKQIGNRELFGEIVFSEHLAVPHPIVPIGRKKKIGIAIVPKGIFWNEEYPDIKLVFLLSPSAIQNEKLIDMTKKIINLIDDQTLFNNLLMCDNEQDFYDKFIN